MYYSEDETTESVPEAPGAKAAFDDLPDIEIDDLEEEIDIPTVSESDEMEDELEDEVTPPVSEKPEEIVR